MKKTNILSIAITIALILTSCDLVAQIYQNPAVAASADRRRRVDSTLLMPTGCGAPWPLSSVDKAQKHAGQYYDSCNKRFYLYDPKLDSWSTITGIYDATVDFDVHANPNTSGTTFNPNTPGLTTVIYVSDIDGSLWTWNGTAYVIYNQFGWGLFGNVASSTNFLGTTNAENLRFKTHNAPAGFLGTTNTSFGLGAFDAITTGTENTAIGSNTANQITSGNSNTGIGYAALNFNTIGNNNTGIGYGALNTNISGSNNTALGYTALGASSGSGNVAVGNFAGYYNMGKSNMYYLNNRDQGSEANDTSKSLNIGFFNANPLLQRYKVIGRLEIRDGTQAAGYIFTSDANGNGKWAAPATSGTVTSIATGLGLSGGPITTTGTILVDTASSSILSRQRAASTYQTIITNPVTGLGTQNFVPKWNNAGGTALGNSLIRDDGTYVGIGGAPDSKFQINGGSSYGFRIGYLNTSNNYLDADNNIIRTGSGSQIANFSTNGSLFNKAVAVSAAGAASTPAALFSGSPFAGTGTTSVPLVYINGGTAPTTFSTAKTYFGINAESGFTGDFLKLNLNGVDELAINSVGSIYTNGYVSANAANGGFNVRSRGWLTCPSDGVWTLTNNASTDFSRLQFGGTTSSFPAIARNGTGIDIKLADNSAYTGLTALTLTGNTSVTSPLLIGGTGTTQSLTYKTTTGVGTTGADHIFQVGNNGATEAMRIKNDGNIYINNDATIGASSGTGNKLQFTNSVRTDNFRQRTYGTTHTGFVWNLAGSDLMYLNDDGQLQTNSLSTGGITATSFGLSGVGLIPLNIASTNNSIARLSLTSHSNTWYIDNRGTSNVTNDRLAISTGGSDYLSILTSGNVGIGTASPSAKLHVISTTEQQRLGYDASNYVKTTVSSTGGVTLDAVGSGSGFTFSDNVGIGTSTLTGAKLTIVGSTQIPLISLDNGTDPSIIEFLRSPYTARGYAGMMGGPEYNWSLNMKYPNGSLHEYGNDNTKAAIWGALFSLDGTTPGYQYQYAPSGVSGDIWTNSGSKLLVYHTPGHMVINTDAASIAGGVFNAGLTVPRDGAASIAGVTDLVLEGAQATGTNGTVYVNAYNTGDVVLASGGGKVGIGTYAPAASTLLHVASTTQGVLLAPMTAAQMAAISSPTEGTLVYDLTNHLYKFWNGSAWTAL